MRRGRGLSAISNPDGSYTVPGYCSWLPFSSLADACKLPTPEQVAANDLSNVGPAASPALVEQLKQQWAQTDAQACAANPQQCAEYNFALNNPTLSAAIGTGETAQSVGSVLDALSSSSSSGLSTTVLVALAVALGLGLVIATR